VFAPKYTRTVIINDTTEDIFDRDETVRIYGYFVSLRVGLSTWEFQDADDVVFMVGALSPLVDCPKNIDMSFIITNGLKVENTGSNILDMTFFHSQIGL